MITLPTFTVSEFMSRELLYLEAGSRLDLAKAPILDFGVTAVPVLDEDHRPIGVVSLRDLVRADRPAQMSSPARSILAEAPLEQAARILAEESLHHLVVVDATGRAVGMLSALDVLRALVGLPAAAPRQSSAHHEELRAPEPAADEGAIPEGVRVP
jgi:CBS-domain-containing membrane protein